MKKYFALIAVAVMAVCLSSCSDDDNDAPKQSQYLTQEEFSQKIEGKLWEVAGPLYLNRYDEQVIMGGASFPLHGLKFENGTVTAFIETPVGVIVYDDEGNWNRYYRLTSDSYSYDPINGTLTFEIPSFIIGYPGDKQTWILNYSYGTIMCVSRKGVVPFYASGVPEQERGDYDETDNDPLSTEVYKLSVLPKDFEQEEYYDKYTTTQPGHRKP